MPDTQNVGAPQAPSRWIADIPKNSREVLRVELSSFQGHDLINLRVWFDSGNGERRPGKAGIALRVEKLPELQAAIAKSIEAARSEGLL